MLSVRFAVKSFQKAISENSCAIYSPPPPVPPFVSLLNIHKRKPLNLKSFPAHTPMNATVSPWWLRDPMNKPTEGREGGWAQSEGVEPNWIFLPLWSPLNPRKCNRLNPGWRCCGFTRVSRAVPCQAGSTMTREKGGGKKEKKKIDAILLPD